MHKNKGKEAGTIWPNLDW